MKKLLPCDVLLSPAEFSLSLSVFLAWSECWKLLVKLRNHCSLIELLSVAFCQIVSLQIEEACFEYLPALLIFP